MRLWSVVASQLQTPESYLWVGSRCGVSGSETVVAMSISDLLQGREIRGEIRDLLVGVDARGLSLFGLAEERHQAARLHRRRILDPELEMPEIVRVQSAGDGRPACHMRAGG